jgi:hypothetical protein
MDEGFESVFQKSRDSFVSGSSTEVFETFREHHDLFWFFIAGGPPDSGAIEIAKRIDGNLYTKYFVNHIKTLKKLGYGNSVDSTNWLYDCQDSRHIMMSICLFTKIPQIANARIVEIGGGFGNFLRLNYKIQEFKSWNIIDIPHIGELQRWYLEKSQIPQELYNIISSDSKPSFDSDIVIGTHSLSELSWDIFENYFSDIVKRTTYLLYSYHVSRPSESLIIRKRNMIESEFECLSDIPSEGGCVRNCVFIRKSRDVQ